MTRIEVVDDVGHEMSEKQTMQEEEEELRESKTTRKHYLRQPCEQERIEREMMHLPFRSWCRCCIKRREREEDCRKAIEEERQVQELHLGNLFLEEENEDVGVFGCPRQRDESCAKALWFRDGRCENGHVEG